MMKKKTFILNWEDIWILIPYCLPNDEKKIQECQIVSNRKCCNFSWFKKFIERGCKKRWYNLIPLRCRLSSFKTVGLGECFWNLLWWMNFWNSFYSIILGFFLWMGASASLCTKFSWRPWKTGYYFVFMWMKICYHEIFLYKLGVIIKVMQIKSWAWTVN